MNKDHLAKEAERLLKDDVLLHALADMRRNALDALVSADASNTISILRAQQSVAACDEIQNVLSSYVVAGKSKDHRPVV